MRSKASGETEHLLRRDVQRYQISPTGDSDDPASDDGGRVRVEVLKTPSAGKFEANKGDNEEQLRLQRNKRLLRLQHRFISFLGWSFDGFSVLISLTDVVSDVLVAMQFWRDGHMLWAWLVLGCFINSNLVYSIIIALFGIKHASSRIEDSLRFPKWLKDLPVIVIVMLVFPLAQLAPAGNYLLQTFFVNKRNKDDDVDNDRYDIETFGSESLQAANVQRIMSDEARAIQHDEATVGRLLKAVKAQVQTHGMLFAETVVESIPQSIVQLLAITFLGNPTTLQVASMSLSVLSVVTKGYFVGLSCNTRIVVSKFFMVGFDILSMFYIFSSVLAEGRSEDVNVFGSSLRISMLSYVWLIRLCCGMAMNVLFTLVGGISVILFKSRERFCDYVLVSFISLLAQVPALLLFEASKLSWLVGASWLIEPRGSNLESGTVMYAFLRQAKDRAELLSRSHHLIVEGLKGNRFAFTHDHEPIASISLLVGVYDPAVLVHRRMTELEREWARRNDNDGGGGGCSSHRDHHHHRDPRSQIQSVDAAAVKEDEWDQQEPPLFSGCFSPGRDVDPRRRDEIRESFLASRGMIVPSEIIRSRRGGMAYCYPYSYRDPTSFERFVLALFDSEIWPQRTGQELVWQQLASCMQIAILFSNRHALQEIRRHIAAEDRATSNSPRLEESPLTISSVAPILHKKDEKALESLRVERLSRALSARRCFKVYAQYYLYDKMMFVHRDCNISETVCYYLLVIWVVTAWLTSFISLSYPFIDAAMNFSRLNLLQRVFMYGSAGCLAAVLLTVPAWLDYLPFILTQTDAVKSFTGREVKLAVARYHVPSVEQVLLREVPCELIPRDVLVNMVAPLLDADRIDMSQLTARQCEEYRTQL